MKKIQKQWRRSLPVGALLVGLSVFATSCGSESASESSESTVDGGTVRLGMWGSPTDTLDLTQARTFLPYAVGLNIFDSLVLLQGDEVNLQLAESIEPNGDATEWTITIRDGVNFHDGSELDADDVLDSLVYTGQSQNFGSMYADVDWAQSTSDGDRTVKLAMTTPSAGFVENTLALGSVVFPAGADADFFAAPIGSGPFKLESFSPDTGAVLVKNEEYWDGAPILDRVEVQSIVDPGARATALTSGQLDYALQIPSTDAATLSDGFKVVDFGSANSNAFAFSMNSNIAPFDDPEVREAFRLAVDREQLVDTVFRGDGEVGNDVFGKGLPGYNDSLEQRNKDLEKARAVLDEKNVEEVTILAAETTAGILDSVRLLQQQLAEVGVELNIDEADPSSLYSDFERMGKSQMFAQYMINRPVMSVLLTYTSPESPMNFMGWNDPEYTELLSTIRQSTDENERQDALDQAQQLLWDRGGDIQWGYQTNLDGSVSNLTGVDLTQSVPLFAKASYTA